MYAPAGGSQLTCETSGKGKAYWLQMYFLPTVHQLSTCLSPTISPTASLSRSDFFQLFRAKTCREKQKTPKNFYV